MLMQAEPVYQCYDALARQIRKERQKPQKKSWRMTERDVRRAKKRTRVIYLSPQGKTFNQSMAEEFAQEEDLVLFMRTLRRD